MCSSPSPTATYGLQGAMEKALRAFLYRFVPQRLLPSWILFWKGRRSELTTRHGWARSLRSMAPLELDGEPLPWIPYAAVDFLIERLGPGMSVFEVGAGHSTLF